MGRGEKKKTVDSVLSIHTRGIKNVRAKYYLLYNLASVAIPFTIHQHPRENVFRSMLKTAVAISFLIFTVTSLVIEGSEKINEGRKGPFY